MNLRSYINDRAFYYLRRRVRKIRVTVKTWNRVEELSVRYRSSIADVLAMLPQEPYFQLRIAYKNSKGVFDEEIIAPHKLTVIAVQHNDIITLMPKFKLRPSKFPGQLFTVERG
jgi:hypothetical protein